MEDLKMSLWDNIGCTDSLCTLKPKVAKKGQLTHGGCRCLHGLSTQKRMEVEKALFILASDKKILITALEHISDQLKMMHNLAENEGFCVLSATRSVIDHINTALEEAE